MRDFSKVAPNVWKSKKFWQLPDDDARLAYFYVLTNEHVNSAGCYNLLDGYAVADLRWTPERYAKAMESLCRTGLVEVEEDESTVLITNWTAFNEPTNAKHALGILNEVSKASSRRLKYKRALEYQEIIGRKGFGKDRTIAKTIESLIEALGKGITTRPDLDRDSDLDESETETRLDLEARKLARGAVAAAPNGAAPTPSDDEDPPPIPSHLDTPFLRKHA